MNTHFDSDEEENANKVKLLVENSLYNRRWGNKVSDNWFEPDPEYDFFFDRQLVIKRYLRLINSPYYHAEPVELFDRPKLSKPKDASLPPYLDAKGRKIFAAVREKILRAVPIYEHFFGVITTTMTVRTLFFEIKLCGFRYNYKLQEWEYASCPNKRLQKKG